MASGKKNGTKKVYHMGKHFRTYHVLSYILVSVVVMIFYFIYNYLFAGSVSPVMLAALFILIEAGLMLAINKGGSWIRKVYYYELDDHGLTIVTNRQRVTYTWDKFTGVHMGLHSFVDLCPVHYTYEGKDVTFSQYLEDMWGMHLEILDRISDHVTIPDGLISQLKAFSKD